MLTIISIFLEPNQIYQKKLYLGVVRYPDKVKLVSTGRIASVCSGREGEGASPPYPRKYIFPAKGNIFDLPKEIYFSLLTCVYFYLQRGIYLLSRLEKSNTGALPDPIYENKCCEQSCVLLQGSSGEQLLREDCSGNMYFLRTKGTGKYINVQMSENLTEGLYSVQEKGVN